MPCSSIRRGRRAALVAATLGLACAPVASQAQVLFSDNFDTDTTSNYDIYSFDQATSTTNVATGAVGDVSYTAAFKYTDYIFRDTATDEISVRHGYIPLAPNTPAGATAGYGLRLDVNNVGGTGSTTGGQAVINLLPKVSQYLGGVAPSGNYKVTVDVFMDYNGPATGGVGSTEFMVLGMNQKSSGSPGLSGVVIADPAQQQKGQSIAIDGERGNGADYRLFSANSRLSNTLDPSTGYFAQPDANGNSGGNGENPYFANNLFPAISTDTPDGFETNGAPGKRWVTLQAQYVDGVAYYYIDAHRGAGYQLIAARSDLTSTSGTIALGYADTIGGRAATETSTATVGLVGDTINGVDANFVIYDNLSVEQLPSTVKPTWNAGSGSWTDGTKWSGGTPNSATSFAVFGASAAGSTVTVSSPVTAREIDFDNSGMTIGGPGTLTMDSPGTTGGVMGTFYVKQGAHTLSAPVAANQNILFHAEAGSSLTFTQPIADTTFQFTKSGDGTVNLRGGRNGGLIVLGGKINLVPGSGTMVTNSILIVGPITGVGQRGSIDLNDNKLVLDYTGTVGSATSNIRSTIKGAFTGGTWAGQGITSSLAVSDPQKIKGVGYWEASDLLGTTDSSTATWFGQSVDGTALLMAVTYIGDLNFDGKVDGDDFALIDRSKSLYGVSTAVDPRGIAAGTAGWINGDLNYDGAIDASDYALIDKTYGILHGLSPDFLAQREAEFGADYVTSLVSSVPEPTTLGLLGVAALIAAGRRRRH